MSPEAVTAIGGIIGALIATITFLFRALVVSKNDTIKIVSEDRDYWKEVATGVRRGPTGKEGTPLD